MGQQKSSQILAKQFFLSFKPIRLFSLKLDYLSASIVNYVILTYRERHFPILLKNGATDPFCDPRYTVVNMEMGIKYYHNQN
jgi:hypothetical protein